MENRTCAHCGNRLADDDAFARLGGAALCDEPGDEPDCYRLVSIYGHPMPGDVTQCGDCLLVRAHDFEIMAASWRERAERAEARARELTESARVLGARSTIASTPEVLDAAATQTDRWSEALKLLSLD